jgi:hypothetical protein
METQRRNPTTKRRAVADETLEVCENVPLGRLMALARKPGVALRMWLAVLIVAGGDNGVRGCGYDSLACAARKPGGQVVNRSTPFSRAGHAAGLPLSISSNCYGQRDDQDDRDHVHSPRRVRGRADRQEQQSTGDSEVPAPFDEQGRSNGAQRQCTVEIASAGDHEASVPSRGPTSGGWR